MASGNGGILFGPTLGIGLPIQTPSGHDMSNSDQHGSSNALTDYFGNYNQYPKGAGYDIVMGSGQNKRPRIEGNLTNVAPYGARAAKRSRLEVQNGGLGGFMTEGIITALSDAAGGSRGEINVRGITFGLPRDDNTYKQTIGFLSNPTIPANETVLKKIPGFELPGEYDILIMRHHLQKEHQFVRRQPNADMIVDETPRTSYTIPGVNRFLLTKEAVYKTPQEYLDGMRIAKLRALSEINDDLFLDDNQRWHISCADDILRVFGFGGVIDTENFGDNTSSVNYLPNGLNVAQVNANDKKVNRVIYGRVDMYNVFGPGLEVGTPLYLIVKRVKRAMVYRVDSTRDMTLSDVNFMTASSYTYENNTPQLVTEYTTRPFAFIPWADNKKKHPSREDLAYLSPLGTVEYGRAIHIAYVMKEDNIGADNLQATMATDLQAIHTRNLLDAYLC